MSDSDEAEGVTRDTSITLSEEFIFFMKSCGEGEFNSDIWWLTCYRIYGEI